MGEEERLVNIPALPDYPFQVKIISWQEAEETKLLDDLGKGKAKGKGQGKDGKGKNKGKDDDPWFKGKGKSKGKDEDPWNKGKGKSAKPDANAQAQEKTHSQ